MLLLLLHCQVKKFMYKSFLLSSILFSSHFSLFTVGCYLLLQSPGKPNNSKNKTRKDVGHQIMNDSRVPSKLTPFILQEKVPPLEKGWSSSGRQLHPTSFPNIQQRYCTPCIHTEEYGKRAAIYTIVRGEGRDDEDITYRILHVYNSTASIKKRESLRRRRSKPSRKSPKVSKMATKESQSAATKKVRLSPLNEGTLEPCYVNQNDTSFLGTKRKRRRSKTPERVKEPQEVMHEEAQSAAKKARISPFNERDIDPAVDQFMHIFDQKDINDDPHLDVDPDTLMKGLAGFFDSLDLPMSDPPIEQFEGDHSNPIREVYEHWQRSEYDIDRQANLSFDEFSVASDELLSLEGSNHSRSGSDRIKLPLEIHVTLDQASSTEEREAVVYNAESNKVDDKSDRSGILDHCSSERSSTPSLDDEESQTIKDTLEEAKTLIRDRLNEVHESRRDYCESQIASWARGKLLDLCR